MPGYGPRYWAERTADNRRRSHPKFRGSHTADAVVIGGGLTGATAAYVLANAADCDVMLLEAERVADGSTAGSLGAIVPQPDATFRRSKPPRAGAWRGRPGRSPRSSAADFAAALKKLPIKSDLTSVGARDQRACGRGRERLRREQAAARSAGVVAPWLSADGSRSRDAAPTRRARSGCATRSSSIRCGRRWDLPAAAEAHGRAHLRTLPRPPHALHAQVRRRRARHRDDSHARRSSSRPASPAALFGQLRRHVRRADGYVVVTEPLSAPMRREVGRRASVVDRSRRHAALAALAARRPRAVRRRGCRPPVAAPRSATRLFRQRTAQLMYELSVRYPAISGLPARLGLGRAGGVDARRAAVDRPAPQLPVSFLRDGVRLARRRAGVAGGPGGTAVLSRRARRDDEAFGFVRHL